MNLRPMPATTVSAQARPTLKSVTVFCGAMPGRGTKYGQLAEGMGRAIARSKLRLVYGGARVGLMGTLANAALDSGGTVVGVIPESFTAIPEAAHHGLTELHVVHDMHQRKALMAELGDAFIALPGGVGTAEEFFEVLTWSHLGLHNKPCVLLNDNEYYRPLLSYIEHAAVEGFITPATRARVIVCKDIEGAIAAIRSP